MTATEDLVIDQLYFVTSYADLKKQSELDDKTLRATLQQLVVKQWVKCFSSPETEVTVSIRDLEVKYAEYYYLASKKGLMAHNMR